MSITTPGYPPFTGASRILVCQASTSSNTISERKVNGRSSGIRSPVMTHPPSPATLPFPFYFFPPIVDGAEVSGWLTKVAVSGTPPRPAVAAPVVLDFRNGKGRRKPLIYAPPDRSFAKSSNFRRADTAPGKEKERRRGKRERAGAFVAGYVRGKSGLRK